MNTSTLRLKIFVIILVLLHSATIIKSATNVPAGNVSGTWTSSGSPYNISGDITIPSGSTLTIQPGVMISFQGHYKLNVQGRLLTIGTPSNMITFTAADTTTGWKGIRFKSVPITNDTSIIEYCKISYGNAISGSFEDKQGGAIFVKDFSKLIVRNNIICNNTADSYGGAIACRYGSSPKIINNVICNNTSKNIGGAIYVFNNSFPIIINNTIANNHAASHGGGIYADGVTPIIKNCIIWGNTAGYYNQIYPNNISSMKYSNVQGGNSGEGNINSNPSFVSPSSGAGTTYNGLTANWALQSSSPSINSAYTGTLSNGKSLELPPFELGGKIRIDGATLDMGAYEYISSTLVGDTINVNSTWSGSVLVNSNVVISNAKTLTISPGTRVKFLGPYELKVKGRLIAVGKNDSFITFSAYDISQGWKGILFPSTATTNDTSKIEHCIFKNGKNSFGGAIFDSNFSKLMIRSNIFSNNLASNSGGAIYCYNSSTKIINNLIVNNTGSIYGGGIYIRSGSPIVTNNTIANNYSNSYGGGIYDTLGTPALRNNIIWGNNSNLYIGLYDNIYPSNLSNVQYNDIGGASYSGTGNINSNPQFKSPSNGTGYLYNGLSGAWRLKSTSPCIDIGTVSVSGLELPNLDLRAADRIWNNRVDIGANEYKSSMNACGTISQNTIWNADTVTVTCDLTIIAEKTLKINPGTKVILQGPYIINVQGMLLAKGTENDSIKFYAKDPSSGWKGINFYDPLYGVNNNDSNIMNFCDITHIKKTVTGNNSIEGSISFSYVTDIKISNCNIHHNTIYGSSAYTKGAGLLLFFSKGVIENNYISNNYSAYSGGGITVFNGSGMIIRNNIVKNNTAMITGGGLDILNCKAFIYNNIIANNTQISSSASSYGGGGIFYWLGIDPAEITSRSLRTQI